MDPGTSPGTGTGFPRGIALLSALRRQALDQALDIAVFEPGRPHPIDDRLRRRRLAAGERRGEQRAGVVGRLVHRPVLLREIEMFFANYNGYFGKTFKALGHSGPRQAREMVVITRDHGVENRSGVAGCALRGLRVALREAAV